MLIRAQRNKFIQKITVKCSFLNYKRPLSFQINELKMEDWLLSIRDVNDNTSSSIIKLRYRIVSISKRNENFQKFNLVIESKIERCVRKKNLV